MGQSTEQIKDRTFSFPDMKLDLSSIPSTSGKRNAMPFTKTLPNCYLLFFV